MDDAEYHNEYHNEVQYPCARLLIKRAFSEPLDEGWFTTMCKPSPEALGQKPQDVLGCVHVLSASSDANRKDTKSGDKVSDIVKLLPGLTGEELKQLNQEVMNAAMKAPDE